MKSPDLERILSRIKKHKKVEPEVVQVAPEVVDPIDVENLDAAMEEMRQRLEDRQRDI